MPQDHFKILRGSRRGRKVRTLAMEGPRRARPTLGLVKEALFQMLEARLGADAVPGWAFFDACAGTGQMAFEAESIGYAPVHACEVEEDRLAQLIAEAQRHEAQIHIRRRDFRRLAPLIRAEPRSIVFVDPPYSFWKRDGACPAMDRLLHNLLHAGEASGAGASAEAIVLIHGPHFYQPPETEGPGGRITAREEREYRRQRVALLHLELHTSGEGTPPQ